MSDMDSATGGGVQKAICTICFEHLKPFVEDLQMIPICGHVFHELCIQQWLEYCPAKKKPTCPVCKQSCSRQNITRLYFQSTGESTQLSSSFSTQGPADADARTLVEEGKKLEGKLPVLTTTFENLQAHLKKVEDESSSSSKVLQSSSPSHNQRSKSQQFVGNQQMQTSLQSTFGDSLERGPRSERVEGPFDIFRPANLYSVKLKKPLHVLNKERKKEVERAKNAIAPIHLRSGMVLLKNFINHIDQVKILNISRDLGIGPGGFYRPGYKNSAKLLLQMMCLGMDWDPDSRLYRDSRSFDGAVPAKIPCVLKDLVNGALHTTLNFLVQSAKSADEIPTMSPDICIVNFYNKSGKLGLHQDRDESPASLEKGLPVVSFSIGDSAEFLYSDGRDVNKADKVILESGDVLIFGGKSRHIFHGVPSIIPDTAPVSLINQTNLLPGRLNLTFRQF